MNQHTKSHKLQVFCASVLALSTKTILADRQGRLSPKPLQQIPLSLIVLSPFPSLLGVP